MKSSKRQRIEKMIKKFRYVDSYLLNLYSAKVYTHADLDKLERLFEREISHVWINYRDEEVLFGDADIYIWGEVEKLFRGSYKPLNSRRWGGLTHYTSIRRALNSSDFRRDFLQRKIKTWANPSFEYIIEEDRNRVFYYSHKNKDEEAFIASSKKVLNNLDYKGINWKLIPVDEKEFDRLLDNERFFRGRIIDDITINLSSENLSEKVVYEGYCFELIAGHSDSPEKPYGKVLTYRNGKRIDGEIKFFVRTELEKELWDRIGVDVEVDPHFDDEDVKEVIEEEDE